MLKRLCAALAALFVLAAPAFGAGTVPGFSLTPEFDNAGNLAAGCKLYIIQAGTVSTPQNAYQDTGLTITQPNPMTCDATGRLPQWFVADGTIKLRLTDKTGATLFTGDNLLVIGPSSGGGGGGGTVDPTTVMQTGDMKIVYGTGIVSGFVRANGRTIGSATSGASERANADTQALFEYLWGADNSLAVSGGRGTSAAADWAANKTIALPDFRGRAIAGLDDMGNSDAGVLSPAYAGCGVTHIGSLCGSQSHALTATEIPPLTGTVPGQQFSFNVSSHSNGSNLAFTVVDDVALGSAYSHILTFPSQNIPVNGNGGSAHSIVPPEALVTIYIKL